LAPSERDKKEERLSSRIFGYFLTNVRKSNKILGSCHVFQVSVSRGPKRSSADSPAEGRQAIRTEKKVSEERKTVCFHKNLNKIPAFLAVPRLGFASFSTFFEMTLVFLEGLPVDLLGDLPFSLFFLVRSHEDLEELASVLLTALLSS